MAFMRIAAVVGASMLVASSAWSQSVVKGSEVPATAAPAVADKSWPIVLSRAGSKSAAAAALWSAEEIEAAKARCSTLLSGLDVIATAETPLRESGHCGSAAPMKLVSIGRGANQVTFSPPPLVTCELIAGLAKWLEQDVQPLARRQLGAPIARVETMSSYSCRTAYGRPGSRLSEHGKANAVDIAAFSTERNVTASVEGDWGTTQREYAARSKRDAAPTSEPSREPAPQTTASIRPAPAAPAPVTTAESGPLPRLPGISLQFSGFGPAPALGFDQPSRLGGPKTRNAATAAIPPPPPAPHSGATTAAGRTEFLRAIHKAACRTFGTVLGPEANKTHANHFHLDMAERVRNTRVCE